MRVSEHRPWAFIIVGVAAVIATLMWIVAERTVHFVEALLLLLEPRSTVSREPEQSVSAVSSAARHGEPNANADRESPRARLADDSGQEPWAAAPSSRLCSSALRLLGSVVHAAHPERSIAAVHVHGGTQLVNIGERVDGLTLLALRPTRAYLQADEGTVCMLPVLPSGEPRAAVAKSEPATKPRAGKKPVFEPAELSAGIRPLGAERFAISPSLLEKALGNVAALRRSARFRVKSENGRVVGLELTSMRAKSPLAHLGLRKGDVVRNLNGHNLAEPDGALQAFAHIKSQSESSLAIFRNGTPQTLTYVKE